MPAPSPRPFHARWIGLLLFLSAVSSGCHTHDHAPDAAADDEHPSVAVTVWSLRHEVFAEYELPVVGEPSHFATHVSDVSSGLPRRAGPVSYRLQPTSGAPFTVVDEAPARDGIYLTEVTYPRAGDWQLTLEVPGPDGVDAIDLGTVQVHASEADLAEAPVPEHVEGISFLKEQQWLLPTLTGTVSRRSLEEQLTSPGRIRPDPGRVADLVPPLAGRLEAVAGRGLPALGDSVTAGDVLAWVQPPLSEALVGAVSARAEVARLEVDVARTRAALERVRSLHEQEARSARELEEADFAHRAAVAARDGAHGALAAYEAAGISSADGEAGGPPRFAIRAPIDGVVDEVLAVAGQSVSTDGPILRIVDAATVHVEVQVRAEDLGLLDPARPPRLTLTLARTTPVELPPGEARLVHIGLHVDERTGRAPVVFAMSNADLRWRPGTAVEVSIGTGRADAALSIPASALIDEEGVTVVFVQVGGETFERRVVRTGLTDGRNVEVLSGLTDGERVVTDGAYAVRLASVSTTEAAHGHAH